MHAVEGVATGEIVDDTDQMIRGAGMNRRDEQSFDIVGGAGPARETAEIFRAAHVDARQLEGKRARHHQPFRMAVDQVTQRDAGSSAADGSGSTFTHA